MHKHTFRIALLAAAIAVTPAAFAAQAQTAQAAAPANQQHLQVQQRSLLDELDLTAAQRTSIQAAMKQNFEQLRPQLQSLTQSRRTFEQTQPGASGYQSAVNTLAQEEGNFARSRVQHEGGLRAQIYGLLTQAQRTKLQSLLAEREAKLQQAQQQQAQQQSGNAAPPASH